MTETAIQRIIPESELAVELSPLEATELAYPRELTDAETAVLERLPVLIECDKELVPYFYRALRDRLKARQLRCIYLDGRPTGQEPPGQVQGAIGTMMAQLRDAVRGASDERVVVLPHLDLLTTSQGGLTTEAREVTPLLYENPELVWVGFKDPSFPLPEVISSLFPRRITILGVARNRLAKLVTQREARKFGKGLDVFALYKHVSGLNAIRLRRLLSVVHGEDYPAKPDAALHSIRTSTLTGEVTLPNVRLETDIGGYAKVKERLRNEVLSLLERKDETNTGEELSEIESLLPRGMIFWGPPGTGKTLFAKAMATELGAAVIVVSGPELKSKWVGESEENLRRVFLRARQNAPSIIIFDELDSFAHARGMHVGAGVEHSMVNQLLTEMDGFRKEELVFVVGTTNFVESIDPALLRPGRFEFHLAIPYPDAADRKAILDIWNRKFALQFSEAALAYAVKRTEELAPGHNTPYSGDHLQALCRQIARTRLRTNLRGPTESNHIDDAIEAYAEYAELTPAEEIVIATHEAGHAIVGLHCEHSPPIDRISIRGDLSGAIAFVRHASREHQYVVTRSELLDQICVLYGGREAESLFFNELSLGSGSDVARATSIAEALVEDYGLGDTAVGVRKLERDGKRVRSEALQSAVERSMASILEEQRTRAKRILEEQRESVLALRTLLLEKKVLDRATISELLKKGA